MTNEIIYGALAIPYKIENDQYKFLLLKHIKGFWTFPGGGKDKDDPTLEDALTRELKEELGIDVSKSALVYTNLVNRFIYDDNKPERAGKNGETHFYLLRLKGNEVFSSWDKIADYGWFTKKEIAELLPYPAEKRMFLEAINQLEKI